MQNQSEEYSTDSEGSLTQVLRTLLPSPVSADSPWTGTGSTLKSLSLIIPIEPMSVQHGARVGRNGHFFNDPKKVDYFERIKQESQHLLPSTPIHGPVVIKYAFFHERPKRLLKKSSPEGAIPMDQKPDYDNLAKGLSDGLTRAGFLKDDKQIWAAFIFSMYREITLFPRIEIQIFYERTKTSPKGAKISRDEQAGKPSFRFTHK